MCIRDSDKLAGVLTRRNGTGDGMSFDPPEGGPQQVLGGLTVSNDKELVTALVDSEAFRFRQCRLAFNYLYGRDEKMCIRDRPDDLRDVIGGSGIGLCCKRHCGSLVVCGDGGPASMGRAPAPGAPCDDERDQADDKHSGSARGDSHLLSNGRGA